MVFEIVCWSQGALQDLRVWRQLWETSDFILNFASNTVWIIAISLHVKPVVWTSKGDQVSYWVLNVARFNYVSSDKRALGKTDYIKLILTKDWMFFYFFASFFNLDVHRSEYGCDITITYLNALDISTCSLVEDVDVVLQLWFSTLLSNTVEDNGWGLDNLSIWILHQWLRLESRSLFPTFPSSH